MTVPEPATTDRARRRPDRRAMATAGIVGFVVLYLVWTMSPWTWFLDTTPTGGDMGAHVWAPKFLRDELLPNLRLTGWSPDWYAGFPAFTFYMIIPSLAIVMVNVGVEFSVGPLDVDLDFYAFLGFVLATAELTRRLRLDAAARVVSVVGAGALSIALSWRWDGQRRDPASLLPWSPVDPFTYNDASMDRFVAAIVLPMAVGSLAHHLARGRGRWRPFLTVAAVLVCVLLVPVPYGVAMKLVAISGIVTLPLAAYATGRLAGLAFPGPALLSVMTLPFLFDRSYNIYGGNVMSTMAGEFAFSMGLSIAVLYIGFAVRGMQCGRDRVVAGILLALAGLTHLFAAFFALVVTVALLLIRPGRREVSWLLVAGPVAGLLSAFWVLPFYWNSPYLNDMGWGKEREYVKALWSRSGDFGGQTFLHNHPWLQAFIVLAVVGAVISAFRKVRLGIALALTAGMFAVIFVLLPEGRLWNVRILPFYYLSIYLLAGIAVAEVLRWVADQLRDADDMRADRPTALAALPAVLVAVVVVSMLAFPLRSFPTGSLYMDDDNQEYGLDWLFDLGIDADTLNLGPGWMRYNFTGYEQKATAEEYRHFVATMDEVGREYGCGQSLWEYDGDRLGGYGTPMAPMLLPHWTDGCIGSMEGLYFEASATTPYHFLLQSELSTGPSRAMRDMPYSPLDVARGVEGLRTMGVRYYMAATETAVAQARDVAGLTEIATSGPWVIFLVEGQSVVEGLDHLPVVVDGVDAGGEDWLVPTVAWWESGHDTPLVAADGPSDWPRSSIDDLDDPEYEAALDLDDRVAEMRRLGVISDQWLPRVDTPAVAEVDAVELDTMSIRFEVDQIGLPVLVRASYFPNWEVSGAEGPYRVSPNLMVVVPTDTSVELTYGRSGIELFAAGLTVLGLLLALGSRRFRRVTDDGGAAWWDLARADERLPSRDALLDGIHDGSVTSAELAAISDDVEEIRRRGLLALGASLLLTGWSLLLWIVAVVAIDGLVPGGDELVASVVVLGPAVIGVVVFVFAALPRLVGASVVQATAVRPAMAFSSPAPPGDESAP